MAPLVPQEASRPRLSGSWKRQRSCIPKPKNGSLKSDHIFSYSLDLITTYYRNGLLYALGSSMGAASLEFPSPKLENQYKNNVIARTTRLAACTHAFLALAWTLGFLKVRTLHSKNLILGISDIPLPFSPWVQVMGLQLFCIAVSLGVSISQLQRKRLPNELERTLGVWIALIFTYIIQWRLGMETFDKLFNIPGTYAGLLVPSLALVVDQVRLSNAFAVHLTNLFCFICIRIAIPIKMGEPSPSLYYFIGFVLQCIVLPFASTCILEVRQRRWMLEFHEKESAKQLMLPFWGRVESALHSLQRFITDVATGFAL